MFVNQIVEGTIVTEDRGTLPTIDQSNISGTKNIVIFW